jgi:hypothetical protein
VLQRLRRRRRPAGRAAARHRPPRLQLRRGLRGARRRAVRAGTCRRAHAEPVHRVQPTREVRPTPPARRRARLRRGRDRSSRQGRPHARRTAHARARRRSREGPELRRAHARPAVAGANAVPRRRLRQGRRASHRSGRGVAHRCEARQPGRLLHHVGRWPSGVPRTSHPDARRRRGRHRRTPARRAGRGRDRHARTASRARAARRRTEAVRRRRRRGRRRRHDRRRGRSAHRSSSWVAGPFEGDVLVQCSAHGTPRAASVQVHGDRIDVRWTTPQRRVAPGQSVVLYDLEDRCVLGGGIAT